MTREYHETFGTVIRAAAASLVVVNQCPSSARAESRGGIRAGRSVRIAQFPRYCTSATSRFSSIACHLSSLKVEAAFASARVPAASAEIYLAAYRALFSFRAAKSGGSVVAARIDAVSRQTLTGSITNGTLPAARFADQSIAIVCVAPPCALTVALPR